MANKLLEALRVVVADMANAGGGRASEAADRVIKTEPKLFRQYSRNYARNHLVDMARREMRKMAEASGVERDAQRMLPGFQRLELPSAICIPDGEGDTLYRPLTRATLGELRGAIALRRKQIVEDTAVANKLTEVLDFRVSQGATDDDLVFPAAAASPSVPAPRSVRPIQQPTPSHTRH